MDGPRPKQVDRPERDPHVLALGGFDVTALSVADFDRLGIRVVPRLVLGDKAKHGWMAHSEFAALDPKYDTVQRSYARLAAHDRVEAQRRKVRCPTCRAHPGQPCRGGTIHAYSATVHQARREAAHAQLDITLDGLTLLRTFPCLGTFRHEEWVHSNVALVCCDRCGEEMCVSYDRRPEPEDTAPEPAATQPDFGGF